MTEITDTFEPNELVILADLHSEESPAWQYVDGSMSSLPFWLKNVDDPLYKIYTSRSLARATETVLKPQQTVELRFRVRYPNSAIPSFQHQEE